jgi:hypothetical protein
MGITYRVTLEVKSYILKRKIFFIELPDILVKLFRLREKSKLDAICDVENKKIIILVK